MDDFLNRHFYGKKSKETLAAFTKTIFTSTKFVFISGSLVRSIFDDSVAVKIVDIFHPNNTRHDLYFIYKAFDRTFSGCRDLDHEAFDCKNQIRTFFSPRIIFWVREEKRFRLSDIVTDLDTVV